MKKIRLIYCLSILFSIFFIGCTNSQQNHKELSSKKLDFEHITSFQLHHNGEEIYKSKDKNLIYPILEYIDNSSTFTDEKGKIRKYDEIPSELHLYNSKGESVIIPYKYDTLYEIGFIKINKELYAPNYDFFRYLRSLNEYTNHDTKVDSSVIELFKKYNWTVDYKVNSSNKKIPSSFKHGGGEYPVKLYWAYVNELSKDIDLDFSKYKNSEVKVEIYSLRESFPYEIYDRYSNARGIVIWNDDKIIGSFIDSGRHSGTGCSLKGNTLEEIVHGEWENWIGAYIDYENDTEKYLSSKTPEEIVKIYYDSLNNHNLQLAYGCYSKKSLLGHLYRNLDNNYLFNEDYDEEIIKKAELKEITKWEHGIAEEGIVQYEAVIDFEFTKFIVCPNGTAPRYINLKKENEKAGWRIVGIGTGP